MIKTNRKENTIKNVTIDIVSYFLTVLLRFFVRFIFIYTIGTEYLGLNSVFTSIISMFSLAEMGFNLTVGTMLYKPLAENDEKKINSLINLTKKIFYTVGFVVLLGGCLLIPFIQHFVSNSTIALTNIRIFYFIHVVSSSVSYFFTHKVVLISADQKQYIYKRTTTIFNLVMSVLQMVLLLVFKNYICFLVTQLIFSIIPNFVVSKIADKMYPFLKQKEIQKLTKEEKKDFYKKSFGAFFHKLGSIIVNATDSILISSSALLGVVVLGKYSNYTLIFSSITQLAYLCISGAIASIGNLWVTSDKNKVLDVFKKLQFIQFWITTFCVACLCSLTQPVVETLGNFLNEDLKLGFSIVVISCVNFYLLTMQSVINMFKNAKGLFWHDRYKAIAEAVVNLIASLILMRFLGILGVLLGTTISIVLVNVWFEPYVLFKHGFESNKVGSYMRDYMKTYILHILLMLCITIITFVLIYLLPSGVFWLIVKFGIGIIIPNLCLFLVYRKTERFKYCKNLVVSLFKRSKKSTK